MQKDQPQRPANMHTVVAINQGRQAYTRDKPKLVRLTCSEVETCRSRGSIILDCRSTRLFGDAHIPEAYNVQVSSATFEQNVGWIFPGSEPLVLVVEEDDDVDRAAHKLAFLGLDRRIEGFHLMGEWLESGRPLARVPQIDVTALKKSLRGNSLQVLDVRERQEWEAGHIKGSFNQSVRHLRTARLPFGEETKLAVVCEGGIRSSSACTILSNRRFQKILNVSGGMAAWRRSNFPLVHLS